MTLQAHQLACTRGERKLFKQINVDVTAGDALRVIGTNGSGKTSILRILCGLSAPAEGDVCWNGANIRSVREEFCSQLLYLGHTNGVKDDLTAWENVVVASTLAGYPITQDQAYEALDQLGLDRAADLPTGVLSQGQRKRVALARLPFSMKKSLWILDEPFVALDVASVKNLSNTMNHHLANKGMIIFTTHQEIELNAQRALCLDLNQDALC